MIKFILFFLATQFAYAAPKKMEMIFLSPDKLSMLENYIENLVDLKLYKKIALNELDNCVPMGDGCFHPQYGYIEKSDAKKTADPKIVNEQDMKLKTFNSVETSLVNCDKNYYFDIYCGQARKEKRFAEFEIWFDISSSLKQVDYNKDPNFCKRRTFLEKVMAKCKNNVSYSIYNTSLKQGGDITSVCMSYGINDEKRLISWIKDSQAQKLLLITDIDEVSEEMRSFMSEIGAKTQGDGVKAFTASDLVQYANEFVKGCN